MQNKYTISKIETANPLHEHDSSCCTYVGSWQVDDNENLEGKYDVYYCFRENAKIEMVSILARWSDVGSDYYSYPFFKSTFRNALEWLENQYDRHDYFPTKICSYGWLKFIEDYPKYKDYAKPKDDFDLDDLED